MVLTFCKHVNNRPKCQRPCAIDTNLFYLQVIIWRLVVVTNCEWRLNPSTKTSSKTLTERGGNFLCEFIFYFSIIVLLGPTSEGYCTYHPPNKQGAPKSTTKQNVSPQANLLCCHHQWMPPHQFLQGSIEPIKYGPADPSYQFSTAAKTHSTQKIPHQNHDNLFHRGVCLSQQKCDLQ